MEIKIIDSCINKKLQNDIEKTVFNGDLPFKMVNNIADNRKKAFNPGFSSTIVKNSKIENDSKLWILYDFLELLGINKVLRANIFLQPPCKSNKINGYHKDLEQSHLVLLYYINSSDGGTIFKLGNKTKKVKAEKGRCVIFNGSIKHSGISPTNWKAVLNINLWLEDQIK